MVQSIDPNERSEEVAEKAAKIKEAASEAIDEARRTAKAAWDKAKNRINDMESLKVFFRENPLRAVALTFGVGFLAGLLCRK
jgi:ElaB/YqjD/DUF883 family membrane-anchored ribosome-binding protein